MRKTAAQYGLWSQCDASMIVCNSAHCQQGALPFLYSSSYLLLLPLALWPSSKQTLIDRLWTRKTQKKERGWIGVIWNLVFTIYDTFKLDLKYWWRKGTQSITQGRCCCDPLCRWTFFVPCSFCVFFVFRVHRSVIFNELITFWDWFWDNITTSGSRINLRLWGHPLEKRL